jgi:hypothetical protein
MRVLVSLTFALEDEREGDPSIREALSGIYCLIFSRL